MSVSRSLSTGIYLQVFKIKEGETGKTLQTGLVRSIPYRRQKIPSDKYDIDIQNLEILVDKTENSKNSRSVNLLLREQDENELRRAPYDP